MTHHHLESGERRADMDMAALIVTGGPAGAIVAIAILAIAFVAMPEARLFLLASGSLGILVGLILWWKHR